MKMLGKIINKCTPALEALLKSPIFLLISLLKDANSWSYASNMLMVLLNGSEVVCTKISNISSSFVELLINSIIYSI